MKSILLTAGLMALAMPVFAEIEIRDAYARSAMAGAPTGAAFMQIVNTGDTADRLLAVRSDIAERVELHTHIEDSGGVMRMREVEAGLEIPPGETRMLERGGDHVMFMGLRHDLVQGETVPVTLIFERAGERLVEIPVDLDRS